ncbi:DUF1844 domain-containing protein [Thermotoga caldifontis]|uniref:DUF1844 domain-containing protein n=1 Tax=Thermotoga caldifontis TaxID=1508419 RepID=UPI000AEC1AB8|nr:DUF1844 domain-containing protein [Thermotoga caldifontis]
MQEEEKPMKLSMEELIILFFNTIAARCWARLGLTRDEYGELRQDLREARLGIDVLDAVLRVMEDELDEDMKRELEGVVANLKLNYVNQYNKTKEAKT